MNKYVATVHFETTDKPGNEKMERFVTDIVNGHGLEITDVHVEAVYDEQYLNEKWLEGTPKGYND